MTSKILSPMQHDILEDAITDYIVMLRTVKTPADSEGKVLSEAAFLASDISEGRRNRYNEAKDLLEIIRSKPTTTISTH